jgi:hypothetical protein
MHPLIQAAGSLGPPVFSQTPWWIGFWVTTAIILVIVAFVGSIIMVVNRVEYQAAITVTQLSEVKEAASPLSALPTANAHLAAVGKAILGVVAKSK